MVSCISEGRDFQAAVMNCKLKRETGGKCFLISFSISYATLPDDFRFEQCRSRTTLKMGDVPFIVKTLDGLAELNVAGWG